MLQEEGQQLSAEVKRENQEVERSVARIFVEIVNRLMHAEDTEGLHNDCLHPRAGIWEPSQPENRQSLRACPKLPEYSTSCVMRTLFSAPGKLAVLLPPCC